MASTFTTSFGIEKIGSGEQSGTWGTTTNHNLDLLDRIASYTTVALSGTTHTLTIREASPGSGTENLQDGMYRVIKFTGALGANNTVTIAPNTAKTYFIIENATTDSGSSGPYSVVLTQGSGANVTVQNGKNVIVYCDGAGSGAAVVDALADLQVGTVEVTGAAAIDGAATLGSTLTVTGASQFNSTVTVGVDDTGYDVKFFGATSGSYWLWDESADGVVQISTLTVGVNDAGHDVKFFGDTANAYMLWDASADDLILAEPAKLGVGAAPNATFGSYLYTEGTPTANKPILGAYSKGNSNTGGIGLFNDSGNRGIWTTGSVMRFTRTYEGNSTDDMVIDASGVVGIGTAAPDSNHKLEVYGTGTTEVAVRSGNSSEAIINFGDVDSRLRGRIAYNNSSEYLAFWANAGEKVRIGSDGMLMLGGSTSSYDTTPPVAGLSLYYETDTGAATIGTYSSGGTTRLGFSTNTATGANAERLRIEGAGSVWTPTVSGANNNLRLGYLAGEDIESGSNYNTLIGDSAGKEINTGDGNTTVGFQAGDALTTGGYNVAVGYDALSTCATAADNVAVGASALAACTVAGQTAVGNGAGQYHQTGVNFTALGFRALQNNTTGAYTTAVGSYALDANIDGAKNTAVGSNALGANTTADDNTAMGNSAAGSNVDGHSNVAIGHSALFANVKGHYSTVVGTYALDAQAPASLTSMYNSAYGAYAGSALTTGVQNTFIGGQSAGAGVVTGDNNTAVGYISGYDITSGDQNTFLGAYAGYENKAASYNTFLGAYSGFNTDTGTHNTVVGRYAAYSMTSGHNNVIIGENACSNTANEELTTAGYCIAIGHNVNVGSATADYQVVIGTDGTVGKGANTAFLNANTGAAYQGDNNASWTTTSDRRIKKNISDNNVGLDAINQIRVRNYEYRKPEEITDLPPHLAVEKEGVQVGVVAQEIREVLPNVVKEEEETGFLSVSNDDVTWHLVNAVKELSAKVKELEEKLNG